jgi:hypothetical protein
MPVVVPAEPRSGWLDWLKRDLGGYYYPARELDYLASPMTDLLANTQQAAADYPGSLQLWFEVLIDERGYVVLAQPVEPTARPDTPLLPVILADLYGTRFVPAYLDQRPVKSRKQLVVDIQPPATVDPAGLPPPPPPDS